MSPYVSLIRGINVGGRTRLAMADLAEVYRSLGFKNVRTYINSGNVLFESPLIDEREAAAKIESTLMAAVGLEVKVIFRTAAEFEAIVADNPLKNEDQSRLHVAFLSEIPAKEMLQNISNLMRVKAEAEQIAISGREIYIYFHNGVSNSKLSVNLIEKNLGVIATLRNWNTVNKLLAYPNNRIH